VRELARSGELMNASASVPLVARVPDRLARSVRVRVSALPAPAREVLSAAAVIGDEFSWSLLAAAAEVPVEDVSALEQALEARIVEPGRAGNYRFAHALIRDVVYQELAPAQRRALHARVGRALEHSANADGEALFRLAFHFCAAGPHACVAEAFRYSVKAARYARGSFSYELAAEHFQRALSLVEHAERGEADPFPLLLGLAEVQALAGHQERAMSTLELLMDRAHSEGDSENFALAVLAAYDVLRENSWVLPAFRMRLGEALARTTRPGPLRARLLAVQVNAGLFEHSPRERQAIVEEAVEMVRDLGDARTRFTVLNALQPANLSPRLTSYALARADEMKALALGLGDPILVLDAQIWRLQSLLDRGEGVLFTRELAEYAERVRRVRHPAHQWYLEELSAVRAFHEGTLELAEQQLRAHLRLGRAANGFSALGDFGGHLYVLAQQLEPVARRERMREVRAIADDMLREFPGLYIWRLAPAVLALELGEPEEARRHFRNHWRDAPKLDEAQYLLACLVALMELAGALDEKDALHFAYDSALPYAGLQVTTVRVWWGPLSFYLGRAARALGDLAGSRQRFEQAIAESRIAGSRLFELRAKQEYAATLLLGVDDERRQGHDLLLEADAEARALGLP
jgi:hypothetical protein